MQADAFCFDGDAALALEVHGIEDLFVHFALGQGASHFEQAVGERGFAVVDVRDDAEISNELGVHFARLPIFSIAGRIRMARPSFRRACCIRTSDTRSAKTVPDKQQVCHNSKAASACPLNANERKVGTMSARRAARLGRRALQETGARLPHSGRMGSKRNHRRDELRIIPDVLFRSLAPMTEHNPGLTKREQDVYTSTIRERALKKQLAVELFDLPCACQNLRRVTRIVTRIYDQELRKAGLEITQFGLLTALATTGEANQKRLSAGFAMDSTTLTRTLGLLRRQWLVTVRRGKDRGGPPLPPPPRPKTPKGQNQTLLGGGGTRHWRGTIGK